LSVVSILGFILSVFGWGLTGDIVGQMGVEEGQTSNSQEGRGSRERWAGKVMRR
jgi:hypothetical protein